MYNVRAMQAFVEVARLGSFAAAARRLNLSTSSISRLVADLEDWLQTPLLRRTTRHLTLTHAGEQYLDRCRQISEAWDGLRADSLIHTAQPRGVLHVSGAAHPMRKMIVPLLPEFVAAYPAVRLQLHLKDKPTDLVAQGIDVAIRVGETEDSSYIARKCGEISRRMTASPEFLNKHGAPQTIDDVASFPCLIDTTPRYGGRWPIGRRVCVEGPVAVNDGEIVHQLTLAGLGISLLPDFFVEEDIAAGKLVSLFPNELNAPVGVYTLLPIRRQITAAARAFADFMVGRIKAVS